MPRKPGYHLAKIAKGKLGESSKILEEVLELMDAEKQHCRVMALVELSDLLGAVEAYLENHYPDMKLKDLLAMSAITKRAFQNWRRS